MAFMTPEYLNVRAWHFDTIAEGVRPFFAATPFDHLPYGEEDTDETRAFFASLLEIDADDVFDVSRDRFPMWYVRLSASGYTDATDWSGPYNTEREAQQYLIDDMDVDPVTGESLYQDEDE